MAGDSFLKDPKFQDELLKLVVHDRNFMKQAAHLLTVKDFTRTDKGAGTEIEIAAKLALDFWNRYREPMGKYLGFEMKDVCHKNGWAKEVAARHIDYAQRLSSNGIKRIAPDLVLERVRNYKAEHNIMQAIINMQDIMMKGVLTPEQFLSIARQAIDATSKEVGRPVNLFSDREMESRIARRMMQMRRQRFPALLIDPIDRMIRVIARKHIGLVLAPWKRGKTLFFVWLSLAYTLQGLNVLHFTLEDPQEDIEDRFDAAITSLPMMRLVDAEQKFRERFQRYKKRLRSRLKVVDGTDGGMTIAAIENIYEQERNKGFCADAIIIDYDDEIKPRIAQKERRMEFAEIYRDFRAVAARNQLIGWTASQTSRKSEEMKIISGKQVAEDISKIRKCSFAMSLGQGDWGDESIFLWVAAHRYDMQHVGANICTDKARALFYDRDSTLKKEIEELNKQETAT